MDRIDLTDFSGGISEQYAADGFTDRQWAKLKGFVIDSDYTIRTQWAGQSIGTVPGGITALAGFSGSSGSYLVAISATGALWWAVAPSDTAGYIATSAVSWTQITSVASDTYYRFICEILLPIEGLGEVNALLVHSAEGSAPAVAIYENDSTGTIAVKTWSDFYPVDQPNLIKPLPGETLNEATAVTQTATTSWAPVTAFTGGVTSTQPGTKWTIVNDGDYPVSVRIGTGATIATVPPTQGYTHTTALAVGETLQIIAAGGSSLVRIGILLGTYPSAKQNVMPRANTGTIWRNRLMLGDVVYRVDDTKPWTDPGNARRTPHTMFYSEVDVDSFREQATLSAGSYESQIIGMHVIDDYLITITSPEASTDGVRTFRGTLDYIRLQENEVTISVNILRGMVGPTRDFGVAQQVRRASCIWPEAGVVAFLDHLGGVWYTDGNEVDRLDRVGPEMPDNTTVFDEIQSIGKYLFVKRGGRLLVLSILSGLRGENATAAWTELVTPAGVSSLFPVNGSMYFVMNGQPWRFAVSRNVSSDAERGAFNGTQVDLVVASQTLSDEDQHKKVNWFQLGVRTRGRSGNAMLVSSKVNAGPALDPTVVKYERSINRVLKDRDEFVMPAGIGYTVEASSETVFRGDVQVESVTFWGSTGKGSRPLGGSDV